jgi:sterol desaturase/sphingolipid hydroxylase (fatty acid hydroxylase superfamily)
MWNLSRASYYADFVTIPLLAAFALITDVSYHGLTAAMILMMLFGAFIWTFIEYALHRWLFHRKYRREHWVHHIAPARYIGVPPWQTFILFTLVMGGCLGSFGLDGGTGLFTGLAAGYFLYIWMHDKFHHRPRPLRGAWDGPSYWERREREHAMHHTKGIEANFGVVTPVWDMLLRTHRPAP